MKLLRTLFPRLFPAAPEARVNGIGAVHRAITELGESSESLTRAISRAERQTLDPASAIRRARRHREEGGRP